MIPKFEKKSFHQFVARASQDESIDVPIANTLHFDQYSDLAICLNIFFLVLG